MEGKNLLIIFTRNPKLGKVKTRLAKSVGNETALEVYQFLLNRTKEVTQDLNYDKIVYYSEEIEQGDIWNETIYQKNVQNGSDLGTKMKNAFQHGFDNGYGTIVLIGSDLPNISKEIITSGFKHLQNNDVVFGPAIDGGYYLIGLSKMNTSIFENKPWSQDSLLDVTLQELSEQKSSVSLLTPFNDIDTFDDLIESDFYKRNEHIQNIVKQFNPSVKE